MARPDRRTLPLVILYYEGLIYMVNGTGVATCVDVETGERVWQERIGGAFSASPVAGDGKIYLVSETGETVVLRAGRELNVLARNQHGEPSVASPAISNGQLFLRTDRHLIAIGRLATLDACVSQPRVAGSFLRSCRSWLTVRCRQPR